MQLSFDEYDAQADHLIPRAIGYSAGLINFFFRGKLEVTPTDARIFAIADHSVPHTMDQSGYPRRTDNQKMFGFEKVRLRVRNLTADITESGTTVAIPQVMGGLLPGETQTPQLVAVARYHRNRCYRPDLSGERVQVWPIASGAITEPTCTEEVRTNYQEVSVSAPLNISSEADLPRATTVEKMFDFSLDPIPINATDLFIQVVYVGRLGEEPASIALGTLDVSEPTFVAYWNNTDWFYNEDASPPWIMRNDDFPQRALIRGWICAGAPRKEVYRFDIATSGTGMGFAPNAGFMRVAMLFPQAGSTGAGDAFFTSGAAQIAEGGRKPVPRFNSTTGQLRQANREIVQPATLLSPIAGCGISVSATERWCWDPSQRRRGIAFGAVINPLHLQFVATKEPTDVDAPPALQPAFAATTIRTGGALVFDQGLPFVNCPIPNLGSLEADMPP